MQVVVFVWDQISDVLLVKHSPNQLCCITDEIQQSYGNVDQATRILLRSESLNHCFRVFCL